MPLIVPDVEPASMPVSPELAMPPFWALEKLIAAGHGADVAVAILGCRKAAEAAHLNVLPAPAAKILAH